MPVITIDLHPLTVDVRTAEDLEAMNRLAASYNYFDTSREANSVPKDVSAPSSVSPVPLMRQHITAAMEAIGRPATAQEVYDMLLKQGVRLTAKNPRDAVKSYLNGAKKYYERVHGGSGNLWRVRKDTDGDSKEAVH